MKKIFLFLFLVVMLTSCVKDVVLDAKEDPLLAVYCVLKVDSVQELLLSYTKSVTMDEAPRVTDATAVLTDLTEGREAGRFVQVSDSLWQLDYSAIPTHSYRLEVTVPGREPVWAEQTMPAEPPVESAEVNTLTAQDVPWLESFGFEQLVPWADRMKFERPPTKKGYFYRFSSPGTIWMYAEHFTSGQFVPGGSFCTDYPYVDDINLTGKVFEGTKLDVAEDWNEVYAFAFNVSYLSDVPLYRDFLRFPKKEVWSQSYFSIGYLDAERKDRVLHLYFAALSDDYDRYLLDAYQQYYAEQSDDLSTIYLRENMYGNIHGGVGIFGAATEVELPYMLVRVSGLAIRKGSLLDY